TYNRRRYLEAGLAALAPLRDRLALEIVISDDCSPDDTGAFLAGLAARDPAIRVLDRPTRLGAFANTIFVMRGARGRYAVYHADDDRLDHDGLVETIAWLDAHPEVAASYAPIDGYDLATGTSVG